MIISASYRTDIPAFYGTWFMNRLEAGACRVANPYGGNPYTVSLRPEDVAGFVFWSKNPAPFMEPLANLKERGQPFVMHFTITGYPTPLEQSVPDAEQSIILLKTLSELYGARAVIWRYDPIIETSLTSYGWHAKNFRYLAAALAGGVDEVVVSFAHIYRKTKRNLEIAAASHGFSWRDPADDEKAALASQLAGIAADCGMRLTVCAQPSFLVNGIGPARCIDAARLSDVAGRRIFAKTKGNRPDCLCSESRDIGAYDSCPMGCAYCYAVRRRDIAQKRYKAHTPGAISLS